MPTRTAAEDQKLREAFGPPIHPPFHHPDMRGHPMEWNPALTHLGIDRLGIFQYVEVGGHVYRRTNHGQFRWECALSFWNEKVRGAPRSALYLDNYGRKVQ